MLHAYLENLKLYRKEGGKKYSLAHSPAVGTVSVKFRGVVERKADKSNLICYGEAESLCRRENKGLKSRSVFAPCSRL